jgi:hypothetical protein
MWLERQEDVGPDLFAINLGAIRLHRFRPYRFSL